MFLVSLCLSGLLARATFYPGTARVMYRMSLGCDCEDIDGLAPATIGKGHGL